MSFRLTRNTGFTLIEVMACMAILAIVLTAVYRLQSQTIIMTGAAQFYSLAPLLAQSKMSDLDMKTVDDLGNDSGDFGEDLAGWTWDVIVEDVESEYLGTYAENLKRIDMAVSFNDGQFTYGFRTYRLAEDEEK